jgi:hypothetical protein
MSICIEKNQLNQRLMVFQKSGVGQLTWLMDSALPVED